jgi:hypothetical protein
VLYEDSDKRGRETGEMIALIGSALRAARPGIVVEEAENPADALRTALDLAAGGPVLFLYEKLALARDALAAVGAQPLPATEAGPGAFASPGAAGTTDAAQAAVAAATAVVAGAADAAQAAVTDAAAVVADAEKTDAASTASPPAQGRRAMPRTAESQDGSADYGPLAGIGRPWSER